jgi:DNA-directed RNA polymerase specialized sigma24 family protein
MANAPVVVKPFATPCAQRYNCAGMLLLRGLVGGAPPMSSSQSVTHWIGQLKAGDRTAAQQLWQRYFRRLVGLARKKLRGRSLRAADEEDAALSAFDSFCRAAECGRFPQLSDRGGLWQLLVLLTARKALDLVAHERRKKRGGGAVLGESALLGPSSSREAGPGLEQVLGQEPSPEFAAQVAEECRLLLGRLGDAELRAIALWRMEGYTEDEIAAKLCCAPRTVRRRLHLIRSIWEEEGMP